MNTDTASTYRVTTKGLPGCLPHHLGPTYQATTLLGTYQVASHTTEGVDDQSPEPANGALYLDANIQLDGDNDEEMDDSQVKVGSREETPKLLRFWREGIPFTCLTVNRFSNQSSIETTNISETVHLRERQLPLKKSTPFSGLTLSQLSVSE